jgi:hypothetical protein
MDRAVKGDRARLLVALQLLQSPLHREAAMLNFSLWQLPSL